MLSRPIRLQQILHYIPRNIPATVWATTDSRPHGTMATPAFSENAVDPAKTQLYVEQRRSSQEKQTVKICCSMLRGHLPRGNTRAPCKLPSSSEVKSFRRLSFFSWTHHSWRVLAACSAFTEPIENRCAKTTSIALKNAEEYATAFSLRALNRTQMHLVSLPV